MRDLNPSTIILRNLLILCLETRFKIHLGEAHQHTEQEEKQVIQEVNRAICKGHQINRISMIK